MNIAANTTPKALRQLGLVMERTAEAEAEALDAQADLGDALRDLRIAAMVPRKELGFEMCMTEATIRSIERRADSDTAKKYRDAVVRLHR